MPKIILNKRAEAELMTLGFHKIRFNNQMSELDRIRQNLELVEQINHFTSKGGHIKPAPKIVKERIMIQKIKVFILNKVSDIVPLE